MSTPRDFKIYRFNTKDHWKTGLLAKLWVRSDQSIVPQRPLSILPIRYLEESIKADLVTFGGFGSQYWRTSDGKLHWRDKTAYRPCKIAAHPEIQQSSRLVIGREWLWAFKKNTRCLLRYDLITLQLSEVFHLNANHHIVDIATDGWDGVWVCLTPAEDANKKVVLCRIDCYGRTVISIPKFCADVPEHNLLGSKSPLGMTCLVSHNVVVLLNGDGKAITLINIDDAQNPLPVTVSLQLQTPGFIATRIDSDYRDKLVLLGADQFGGALLLLDAAGGLLDKLSNIDSAHDAAMLGNEILVADDKGIMRLSSEPGDTGRDAVGTFLSPMLYSPDHDTLRGWLRAEISALLPKGSALTVTVMGTDDSDIKDRVKNIAKNTTLPPAVRQASIKDRLSSAPRREFTFTSTLDEPGRPSSLSRNNSTLSSSTYAVPLFDRKERWLWLEVSLVAAPNGDLPALNELRVIYPDISLSQYVPAIFRGDVTGHDPKSGDPSGFFRQLLGVLETTTQGIDQTIANLGKNIHPDRTQGEWFDFVARWLDLPWDDALPEEVKRRMLQGGAQLLNLRGTRAGLLWLLKLLFPERKTHVTDINADLGFTVLGSSKQPGLGSSLPTVLTGLPANGAVLSRRATLGCMQLNKAADSDLLGVAPLMGLIRVEIGGDKAADSDLAVLLPKLIEKMIPAGLRVDIRWQPQTLLRASRKLDQGFILDNPSPRQLNKNAQLGLLVLGGGRHQRLPETGLGLGFRLK